MSHHPGYGDQPQAGYGQYGGSQAGPEGTPGRSAEYGQPGQPGPYGGGYGSPYGGFGAPQAPKPGVVPLRPLGVAEILDGTITTMRRYPRPTFALSAALAAVTAVLALLQNLPFFSHTTAALVTSVGMTVLTAVVGHASSVLLAGALAIVLSEGMLGRPVTLAQVWARLKPKVPGLVGLALLTGLLVLLGLVVFLVGALVVGVFVLLAAPAYVLEGTTVTGALKRSLALVRGSWWRVFGVYLLMSIIIVLVSAVVMLPLGVAGAGLAVANGSPDAVLGTGASVVVVLVTTLLSVVTAPVTAYVIGLLYADQRMRREGLDLQLAQAAGLQPQYGQPQHGQYGQPQDGGAQYDQSRYEGAQQDRSSPAEPPRGAAGPTPPGEAPRRDEGWSSPPR